MRERRPSGHGPGEPGPGRSTPGNGPVGGSTGGGGTGGEEPRPAEPHGAEPHGDEPHGEDAYGSHALPAPSVARRYLQWLPAALIVIGLIVGSSPADYIGIAYFTAAPLVAALLLSFRKTAVTGGVSVAFLALLLYTMNTASWVEAVFKLMTTGLVAVLAVTINRIVHSSAKQLASARGIAEAAQLAVLPVPAARMDGMDIAARYTAAQVDALIGGDLYAVQETPYGTRLIVGDVRGKGLGSVQSVAVVIGAFREAAEEERTLEGVAARLERALQRERARRPDPDQFEDFTTAVLAEAPAGESELLRMVNRGHPAPILLSPGSTRYLDPGVPALPLGMGELGHWPDRADTIRFPAGCQLLFYTDGLSEARDASGAFYDPVARLAGQSFPGPDALLDALIADVDAYTGGGTADDMALLAIQRRHHE